MISINRILVGHDFSSFSDAALLEAVRLARRFEAEVYVGFVEVLHRDQSGLAVNAASRADQLASELRKRFASIISPHENVFDEIVTHYEVLRDVAAGPALLAFADERDVDLIVVGTHGRRGFRRMLMGSVAEEVVRKSPCPVLTMRGQLDEVTDVPRRSVIAPVDFSDHALHAVRHARGVAAATGGRLVLVHVLEERLHPAFYNTGMFSQYEDDPDIEDQARHELEQFYKRAGGPDVPVDYEVRRGHAVREIVRIAAQFEPALIVQATHGLTGLDHFLLGSVTEKVVRHSDSPVMTVKAFGKQLVDVHSSDGPSGRS